MHKIELLVDVSSLDMIKTVIESGCDAVFIGNEVELNSYEELREMVEYVHANNKKIYVAFNKIPHEKDIEDSKSKLLKLDELNVDAVVINEPGMSMIVKEIIPNMEVQLGEEANITNYETANFWHEEGIKRVVLSKELTTDEIKSIRDNVSDDLDIEVLVHGSMQISHSGRKLLSNFINNKSQNEDKHMKNKTYSLVEEKRPGLHFPISEDERGTFLYNTEDLCMIDYLPNLIVSGVNSFKIHSKFRNNEYMQKVVKMYRDKIDSIKSNDKADDSTLVVDELLKMDKRDYTTAFYIDSTENEE